MFCISLPASAAAPDARPAPARHTCLCLAPPSAATVAVAAAVAPAAALAVQRVGDDVEQCLRHAIARGEGVRLGVRRPVAALQPVVAVARGMVGAAW